MVFVVVLGVVGVATSGGAVALPNDDAGAADSIAETVERLSPSVAVDLEPVVVSGGVVSTEVDDVLYVFEPSGEISISSSDAGAADAVVVGLPTDLGADSMEVATDGSLAYLASGRRSLARTETGRQGDARRNGDLDRLLRLPDGMG